jgi:hypothetical protein
LLESQPPLLKDSYSKEIIPNRVIMGPVTGGPLQVGFNREIPANLCESDLPFTCGFSLIGMKGPIVLISCSTQRRDLALRQRRPRTALSVISPAAVALRLAVAFTRLPAGAEVRFLGLDSSPQVCSRDHVRGQLRE